MKGRGSQHHQAIVTDTWTYPLPRYLTLPIITALGTVSGQAKDIVLLISRTSFEVLRSTGSDSCMTGTHLGHIVGCMTLCRWRGNLQQSTSSWNPETLRR